MDTWSKHDLARMVHGGNAKARYFYKEHGWHDLNGFNADKYTGRIAHAYKQKLERAVSEAAVNQWPSPNKTPVDAPPTDALAAVTLDEARVEKPIVAIDPRALRATETANTAPTTRVTTRQAASMTVAAPVAASDSITAARRPARRGARLGARRKPTSKPVSSTIDWTKVGSDVPPGPPLPKVSAGKKTPVASMTTSTTQPVYTAAEMAERFKGKKAISSADFAPVTASVADEAYQSRFTNATSLSSSDFYSTRESKVHQGEDIVGMADDLLRVATEGVAQAADEVSNAFNDFLNKGYA